MYSSVDTLWVLLGALLVFFMQAGFAMVETGFTRAKNAGNIIMKNLMDFSIGTVVFWILGFGIMFAGNGLLFGGFDFLIRGNYDGTYPTAAFVGAAILGPRIGKYKKDGTPKAIPGHNLTLGALGVFILWFCWFGFNGGSTVSMTGDDVLVSVSNIFITTNLAAAVSTCTVMVITWICYKKPDVSMTLNGSLAGLVAITAGCDAVTPVGAFWIGLIAGFLVVYGIEFIDKVLKIDDPVGAIGVHGICGAAGTILTGLFAYHLTDEAGNPMGLFYGGGFQLLSIQTLGVLAVIAWVAVAMTIVFFIIKHTIGLRVHAKEEVLGLDREEHGLVSCYADFMPNVEAPADYIPAVPGNVPISQAVPVQLAEDRSVVSASDVNITKIVILSKQNRFETLKTAMNEIGVTGMTVTNVLGCGMQKGITEYYRGVELEMNLLPKIKVEIVVCKVPARTVIETAKRVLYTGNIGDGKIFVYNIENVIKVRTGEEGYDALQDDE